MKSPTSTARVRNSLGKEGGLEDLEAALQKSRSSEEILFHGIHLAMLKTHILSLGIPRKTTRKDIVQATASGTAYGAFHIIQEIASGLPDHLREKGLREMIAHFIEVQATIFDLLANDADKAAETPPPETLN